MLVTLTPDQDGGLNRPDITAKWLIVPVYTLPRHFPGVWRHPRDRVSISYTKIWKV